MWHALLHDLRGCLGGLKATLDLREPQAGLESRDALRMEAGVREGLALTELARALAFGPWPDGALEPVDGWAGALGPDLGALAETFRGRCGLVVKGRDPWPGALLRSFILSLARQLLPQALPEALAVEAEACPDAWILAFSPVLAAPLALQPEGAPKDLHGLWIRAVAARCGISASHAGERLELRIPRGGGGLPPVE
ncbi:MAG TPA: hypothetical protein VFT46_04855 [Holophagaceae bacterium]|nr:hypothetical protein [Holophagaceae bacterium]